MSGNRPAPWGGPSPGWQVIPVANPTGEKDPWDFDVDALPELNALASKLAPDGFNPLDLAYALRRVIAKDLQRAAKAHSNVRASPAMRAYLAVVRGWLENERDPAFWTNTGLGFHNGSPISRRECFQWKAIWAWVLELARNRSEIVLEAVLALKAAFVPRNAASTDLRPLDAAYWTVSSGCEKLD